MFDQFINEYLLNALFLNNDYSQMRHATAESNKKKLLISDPIGYSLVQEGRDRLIETVKQERAPLDIIVCSELPRCIESAQLHAEASGGKPIIIQDRRLNERRWGRWEGTHQDNCYAVYEHDRRDMTAHPDSECVASMVRDVSSLIAELDQTYSGKTIRLLSHADKLQIVELVFSPVEGITHYTDIPYLANAEIKPLTFAPRKTAAEAAVDTLLSVTGPFARGSSELASLRT